MTENGQIVWEDPPNLSSQRRSGTHKWVAILTPLIEYPGNGARINVKDNAKTATAAAQNLRRRIHKIPPGHWEFVSRQMNEQQWGVYARYLGPEDETP